MIKSSMRIYVHVFVSDFDSIYYARKHVCVCLNA